MVEAICVVVDESTFVCCARILRQNEYDFTTEKPVEWEPPTSIEGVFIPTLHD